VDHASQRELVQNGFIASIRGEPCGKPLFETPVFLPRAAVPPGIGVQAGAIPKGPSRHFFQAGKEKDFVFRVKKDCSRWKGEIQLGEPTSHFRSTVLGTSVVLVPENEHRRGIALPTNELGSLFDPAAKVEILPANRIRPGKRDADLQG